MTHKYQTGRQSKYGNTGGILLQNKKNCSLLIIHSNIRHSNFFTDLRPLFKIVKIIAIKPVSFILSIDNNRANETCHYDKVNC